MKLMGHVISLCHTTPRRSVGVTELNRYFDGGSVWNFGLAGIYSIALCDLFAWLERRIDDLYCDQSTAASVNDGTPRRVRSVSLVVDVGLAGRAITQIYGKSRLQNRYEQYESPLAGYFCRVTPRYGGTALLPAKDGIFELSLYEMFTLVEHYLSAGLVQPEDTLPLVDAESCKHQFAEFDITAAAQHPDSAVLKEGQQTVMSTAVAIYHAAESCFEQDTRHNENRQSNRRRIVLERRIFDRSYRDCVSHYAKPRR